MYTSPNVKEQYETQSEIKVKAPQRPLMLPPLHVCGALEVPVPPGATTHAKQRYSGLSWEGCIAERVCGAGGCVTKEGKRSSVGKASETDATPRFTIQCFYSQFFKF